MSKLIDLKTEFDLKYLGLIILLLTISVSTFSATVNSGLIRKISIDKNPVLKSDTLKKIDPKLFAHSSLNQLSENIYFSSFSYQNFANKFFLTINESDGDEDFLEILGLEAFYCGKQEKAVKTLTSVFWDTNDSNQKAEICLNLVKINYLNNQNAEAMKFLNIAKEFKAFYKPREKYDLILTEAKIALSQGSTAKAERLIISGALPMSNKVKGSYNEFNCYLFLGKIYLKAKQFTQAKWFFIQANTVAVNKDYTDGKIETSLLLAKTKIQVGDKDVALQDLAKARKLIDKRHQIYLEDLHSLTQLAKQ